VRGRTDQLHHAAARPAGPLPRARRARGRTHRLASALVTVTIMGLAPLALVGAASSAGAARTTHPPTPSTSSRASRWSVIPCSQAATLVTVTTDSRLVPGCTYTGGFDVTSSHVTLDCQHALVDGTGQGGVGIEVSTPADTDLSGVTIRNCRVQGFGDGMRITRTGFRTLAVGQEYVSGLSGVVIEDSTVSDTNGVGIYVDAYVTDTTIRRVTVTGAGSTAVYLEAGSMGAVVKGDTFLDNGFVEDGPGGSTVDVNGQQLREWGTGREGIAVDGSRHNVITGNTFEGNSAGGVFLYTNCGELVDQDPGSWFPRRYPASGNVITHNTFTGGIDGVWVGSRMGENVIGMDCSDPPYYSSGLTRITLDRAPDNTVKSNSFNDVVYGVRVEDDRATVTNNTFAGGDDTHYAVVVGTPYRTSVLAHPVQGSVVTNNRSTIPNPSPFRWVDGQAGSTVKGNTSGGQAVGWCQGEDLPRDPFIFVLALAPQPVGGPIPPTPVLTIPLVGAQPSCPA